MQLGKILRLTLRAYASSLVGLEKVVPVLVIVCIDSHMLNDCTVLLLAQSSTIAVSGHWGCKGTPQCYPNAKPGVQCASHCAKVCSTAHKTIIDKLMAMNCMFRRLPKRQNGCVILMSSCALYCLCMRTTQSLTCSHHNKDKYRADEPTAELLYYLITLDSFSTCSYSRLCQVLSICKQQPAG